VNILFANYGDFTTNSLNHIGGFANALSARGHSCVVAVPTGKESISATPGPLFIPALYDEVLALPALFPDRGMADVIHAWTPREYVRKFVLAYQRAARKAAKLVIHLEDNEENLISGYARRPPAELRAMPFAELDELMSDSLPHPLRHRTFLRLADHATVIVERLRELVPATVECSLLQPGVDPQYLKPLGDDPELRKSLGLAPGEKVVVFTGSNTFANEPDMRELYAAIRILNQRGIPTRLVRTGFNRPEFLQGISAELKAHVLDLGFIAKARLPGLLGIADVLVQPGRPGPFNDYRLPSKLPEYLASGRPVVLPPTNVALGMRDGADALFLSSGAPENIADCCERILRDPKLAAALGRNGAAFARRHFDLEASSARLIEVYERVLARPPRACWSVIRSSSVSDFTAAADELAAQVRSGLAASAPEDTRTLADDLAAIVRLEDERECSAIVVREKVRLRLEEMVRHLERQRDLTSQHARNLEEKVQAQDRHAKLQKKLTDRHIQNLEARINSIERIARAQAEKTQAAAAEAARIAGELTEAWTEHKKLSARIIEMDAELKAREQRLKSTFRSLSWRVTAPLRDIERLLARLRTGKHSEPAAAPPPPAAREEPRAAEPPPPAAPARPPEPAPVVHRYTFNFDHPRGWSTASNKLLILGWCYENAAAPILGSRAHFAGKTYEGIYGSKRLDVLASTGMKQAEYSGIKIDVPTHLGDHPLVVEVRHEEGWHPYFQTIVHVGNAGDPAQQTEYEKWSEQHEALSPEDLQAIERHIAAFATRPLISVAMPVYNTPEGLLVKAIESVLGQLYTHWELCIADDASTEPHVRQVLERYSAKDARIHVALREKNGHICEASNTALGLATGELLALFDHDDILAPRALYEVAAEFDRHPGAQLVYTDEDKVDMEDRRFDPYFKPDWNPDLNYGQNYVSHLSVYRTALVRDIGGFRKGFEGSQDWDLLLRAIERMPASAIRHVPNVLYHWRAAPGSTALQLAEKDYPVQAARRALEDHFKRTGQDVELLAVPGDHWRVRYPVPSPAPLVSLIMPTRNAVKLVRQAVRSILDLTDYPNFEIVIVDNQSDDPDTTAYFAEIGRGADPRVRVLPYPEGFNYSAINNFAVREARGDVIGFLNNDVEAIAPGWLTEMVSQAARPGIGAVGAMLYYPLNTVQHAGVILGLGGVAGHPFKEFPRGDQGQKNRLRLVQNYSAVTAACLVIMKARFLEVGGFNERDLPIAFNDVDLCCKLIRAGYRNLWTPHAEFYHHESASRGVEDTPEKKVRFQSEIDYMMNTWGELLMADPAYNPNLTLVGEDFSPAYLSRATKSWLAHLS
jgi:glycosyltransferase involved in cell wall biosynthesis